ncbi:RNB domain-containing ribonuclease [soil metagenome]
MNRRLRVDRQVAEVIDRGLQRIRTEFDLADGFPTAVRAEAAALDADTRTAASAVDRRDVELRTLDPHGSRDLDQAFGIEWRDGGFRVHYAIADVAAAVRAEGPMDDEARERGVTVYLPDDRVPLYPPELSEGHASLLPGQDTPALLWTLDVDDDGELGGVHVERAVVVSRAQWDYRTVQAQLDAGAAHEQLEALCAVGTVLAQQEVRRGGISLNLADQEVTATDDGYRLRFDRSTPIEEHNARLSLLTGMAAAQIMLDGGVGLLRTLPPAPSDQLAQLRDVAATLGVVWADDTSYAAWIATIDPAAPQGVAVLTAALRTLRGAGYEAFTTRPATPPVHAALAAPYAHVTAPLRRLADRFANQIVLDLVAGRPVAAWACDALEQLPALMTNATQRAAAVDRAVHDLVEAAVLAPRLGDVFDAVAVRRSGEGTMIHLLDPAVVTVLADGGASDLGAPLRVRLTAVDVDTATVTFARV